MDKIDTINALDEIILNIDESRIELNQLARKSDYVYQARIEQFTRELNTLANNLIMIADELDNETGIL